MLMQKMIFSMLTLFFLLPVYVASAAPSNTVLWFNAAYSALTQANGADSTLIGGYAVNAENQRFMQELLSDWWGVTDRKSADETLEWLLSEGHRSGFAEEMEYYEQQGMLFTSAKEWSKYTDGDLMEAACLARMCKVYQERGAHAIDAWDYCRAMQLLGQYYVAGYYSEEECLEGSLVLAKELQKVYHSWDALMQGYNDGYQYWCRDDITNPESKSYQRNQIFIELKNDPNSLVNTVPWDTNMVKEW